MALYRHRFSGVSASGDIWVFTWWSDSSASLSAAQSAAEQWITTLWDGPTGTDGYASLTTPGVVATGVTTGTIDPATGLQSELAEGIVDLPGTATPPALPADVALVVSLRTTLANRRGRGRFYLPQLAAATLAADGRVASATVTALVGALSAAWQGYSSTGSPVVYSRMNRDFRSIDRFDVGDLFDTQRRRENALTEVRTSATMP